MLASHFSTLNFADAIYDAALALIYPQQCQICDASVESRHDGVACAKCWNETSLFKGTHTLCWKCGALSLAKISEDRREGVLCGRCHEFAFTSARACGFYEGALRASILELKKQPHVPRRVSKLVHERAQCDPLNLADLIIPVPLHPDRERERGFNQASILAGELSRVSGLPIDEHSVVRRAHTERHRAGMDAKARRQSVANAFAARHSEAIAGKRVLLIDDVFTTGATVSACAATLNDAGARDIFVLTLARAQ